MDSRTAAIARSILLQPPPAGRRRAGPGLAIAVALVFGPGLFGPFVLDDHELAEENPRLGSLAGAMRFFEEPAASVLPDGTRRVFYRPLSFLSFWLDRALWDLRPFGFHLASLLLHLGSTWLLYRMLARWLGAGALPSSIAVLWAILPVQMEPVIHIAARSDVLFLFLYLLALSIYTGGDGYGRGILFGFLAIASFLAKEMAISLPVAAILFDLVLRPRVRPEDPRALAPRLAWPLGVLALMTAIQLAVAPAAGAGGWRLAGATGWEYLKILLDPFAYSIDRSRDIVPGAGPAAAFFLAAAGGIALLYLAVRRAPERRRRLVLFAALWAAAAYLPVSNLLPLNAGAADRRLYLPLIGATAAAAAALESALGSRAWIPGGAWRAALVVLGVITAFRTQFFSSEALIVRISLASSPGSPLLFTRLGLCHQRDGKLAEAAAAFEKALEVDADYPPARYNLGLLALEEGDVPRAEVQLSRYILAFPEDPDGWLQLGIAALEDERPAEALDRLREAERLRPGGLAIRYHLALALFRAGDSAAARKILLELARLHPEHAGTRALLEKVSAVMGSGGG